MDKTETWDIGTEKGDIKMGIQEGNNKKLAEQQKKEKFEELRAESR